MASKFSTSEVMTSQRSSTPSPLDQLVVYQSNTLRSIWSLLVAVLLLYTGTVFIYRLCFVEFRMDPDCQVTSSKEQHEPDSGWVTVDWIVTALFVVDLIVSFFFSYEDEFGLEVVSFKDCVKQYLRSTFWINALACVPESWATALLNAVWPNSSTGGANQALRLLRIQRLSRLTKVIRLARLRKLEQLSKLRAISKLLQMKSMRIINLCCVLLWVVHMLACGWYIVAAMHDNPCYTWTGRRGTLLEQGPFDQWWNSMYFVLTVFTTVGFGDMYPISNGEMVYVSIVMAIGAVVHSIIISEVIDIVTSRELVSIFVAHKSELVSMYTGVTDMRVEQAEELNSFVQSQAKNWMCTKYDKEEMTELITKHMSDELLEDLPDALFEGELMKNKFMMMNSLAPFPPRMPLILAMYLQQCHYNHLEVVYKTSEYSWNLFLVLKGVFGYIATPSPHGGLAADDEPPPKPRNNSKDLSAEARRREERRQKAAVANVMRTEDGLPFLLFAARSYFGHAELMLSQPRRCTARCESNEGGTCLSLHRNDLRKLSQEFPQVFATHHRLAAHHSVVRGVKQKSFFVGYKYQELAARTIQKFIKEELPRRLKLRLKKSPTDGLGKLVHDCEVDELLANADQDVVDKRINDKIHALQMSVSAILVHLDGKDTKGNAHSRI